jgi:hypothetical protein
MTDQERLQHLEAENARLQRQLEQAGVPSFPKPDMPRPDELVILHSMVVNRYPQLACAQDQFERALMAIAYFRRSPKLNNQFYPTYWMDAAKDWLRHQAYNPVISLSAFTAAAIGANVMHSMGERYPYDLEFGFQLGGLSKPTCHWRAVLESRRLPAPVPLNRPRQYVETQFNMVQPSDPGIDARGSAGVRVERS